MRSADPGHALQAQRVVRIETPAKGRIMKRLFFGLLMLAVGIVGLGFYRGWFTVNQGKIQQDEQRAKEEVRELMQEVKAKTGERTDKVKERQ